MSAKINNQLFEAHEQALEHGECPSCSNTHGGELILRHGKLGPFLGCSRYPECDYIKPLHHNDGHIVKYLGVPCPECGEELVLRQGRYGMFIGCHGYPDCQHIESPTHTTETNQEKLQSVSCPECTKGKLVERQSRFGKTFWACDNYPSCKFAINSTPVQGQCEQCHFPLLVEKNSKKGKSIQCASRKCQHIQK